MRRSSRKLSILIGSRPGVQYAGLTDLAVFESADNKVAAVEAFVKRHDPDIIFTVAGMTSEAESFGAEVVMRDGGSTMITDSPLSERADPTRLLPRPLYESRSCRTLMESIRVLSERHPDNLVAATLNGPLTVCGLLLGLDRMLLLSIDDPQLLRELLVPITERIIELMNAQIQFGARYVHVAEPTGSLLSPASLREIGLPFLQKLYHQVQVPNHLHICGDVSALLSVLAESGAGAVSVDSMVDMKTAASHFGEDMAVCGNIDVAALLLRGQPEEVEGATRTMLERMGTVGSYIPASSCGIPKLTPPENIDRFVETVRGFE
jgi:MtaA/CmuA family methyltransferase